MEETDHLVSKVQEELMDDQEKLVHEALVD